MSVAAHPTGFVPLSPKPRTAGARDAVHRALLAGADTNGIVVMNRQGMCRPGGVSVNSMQKIVVSLIAADLLEQVRPGAGLRNPVWRVFSTPTLASERQPLPAIPPPCVIARQSAVPVSTGVTKVKKVSTDVLHWCRAYLARGVKLDFLAFCFDLDEHDLTQAVLA